MSEDEKKISMSFAESFLSIDNLRTLFSSACSQIGEAFGCSKCVVLPLGEQLVETCVPLEWSFEPSSIAVQKKVLKLSFALSRLSSNSTKPVVINTSSEDRRFEGVVTELRALNCSSVVVSHSRVHGMPKACVCLYYSNKEAQASVDVELFSSTLTFFGLAVKRILENITTAKVENASVKANSTMVGENETSLSYVVNYDKLGRVSFANSSFCKRFSLNQAQVEGMHYTSLIPLFVAPKEIEKVTNQYTLVFESAFTDPQSFIYEVLGEISEDRDKESVPVLDWLGPSSDGNFESCMLPLPTSTAEGESETLEKAFNSEQDQNRYQRLVEYSDAIIFNSEPNHTIHFISRRALDFFGIAPQDFVSGIDVHWYELVHLEDRERIIEKANEAELSSLGFDEEFRVVNHITGRVRWLLAKLVPVLDSNGLLLGWDGFGIDITQRKEAQEALDSQSKRVRALYTVSSAIRGYLDPANIASRGLSALCDATGAGSGVCYLNNVKNNKELSLISHYGFSSAFAKQAEQKEVDSKLSKYVFEHGQSVVVSDMRTDPRASQDFSEKEELKSAMLVPIIVEEEILGVLGLFHKEVAIFDSSDVMLAAAAANQIGLASRQANLFAAYRKQTKNLSALYRLSHVLSGFLSLDEIFKESFEVIRDELGFKRLWLGLLDETGTRLVGQSAYGPGWRRKLVQVNVEIAGSDQPIAKVVKTKKPLIIGDPEKLLGDYGVKRFFSRFAVQSVGLVPLVSGGQVLGVLAFQPDSANGDFAEEELTLVSSLAAEIAKALRTKRLEERAGDSQKMRSAGLLAAGIAHNFNNLLQAILGQASLLSMQQSHAPQVHRAADIINDAATKGASLVKQLMSFANLEEPSIEVCDVSAVVESGIEVLERKLGDEQTLVVNFAKSLPKAFVDPSQVMRILSALVKNAHESIDGAGEVTIFSDRVEVEAEGPHYEVPEGDYIRIGVRDTGKGMDVETQRRCFEPFFTTKDVDPSSGIGLSGAGLGLAAAYALARKNGGRLVVESAKGRGSLFLLYLPVANQSALKSSIPLESQLEKQTYTKKTAKPRAAANLKLVPSKTKKNGSR